MRLFLLLICTAGLAGAQTVEIDNNWVRVMRVTLAPHQPSPASTLPDSVVVYLADTSMQMDGSTRARKAGDVDFLPAGSHSGENVSDQPAELILVQLKSGPPAEPIALDPVKLDPEHHPVPLENARVRVLHTILEPQVKSPMHQHPHYVVVYITELHTTMVMADGKAIDNPRRPGEVAWRDALQHQTENIGAKTALEIQIEIK